MIWILYYFSCIFYSILCVFSIVTGILYVSGKRELNPVELSDNFVKKIKNKKKFAKRMGIVTIIVGIAQGFTAICLITDLLYYYQSFSWYTGPHISYIPFSFEVELGFTILSFISVFIKLWNKSSKFAWIKIICYSLILFALVFSLVK